MASLVAFSFAVIGLSSYILIFFLYIPQILAKIVSRLCNHIVFRGKAHIRIRSLRFLFLSGKVVVKGLCYTNLDANVYIENLEITVLWWRALFLNRHTSDSNQQSQERAQETPAAFIFAQGVQVRLLNQKARYDFIQKIIEQQTYAVDMQAPVSLLVEEFEGYSLWLYQYLGPVAFDLFYCSFVANDPAISDGILLYFESGKGRYAAVPAPCPLDVYRSCYSLSMDRFQIQYFSIMLDSANASEDSNLQHPDIQQDVLSTESLRTPHSMHSYPPSSVSFEAEMSVIHSPATENEENNESWLQFMISFWMKFQRFMIRLFGYMDTSFTDVLPHQKFTVFEADNLQVEYHYDIPGITVVVSEGQTPAWKAPECLLKICCTGARLYYSPILEKARCVLLERFFPPTFENFEMDTNSKKEGKKRRHRCFQVEMECKAKANQPMIDIIFHPRQPDNDRRSSDAALVNIWCEESFHLSLLYPYIISAGETEANLEFCANFDQVTIDLVQESTLSLTKSPMLTVEGKLGFPIIWNGYRKWTFDIRLLSSKWIFVKEYINVISDILSEMSQDVTYDPLRSFQPTEYFVNLEFKSGYSLFFSADSLNDWKNPSQMTMENEWALEAVGNTFKMKFHLPFLFPMPLTWDMNWLLEAPRLKIWFHWPMEAELRKQLGNCQKIVDISNFDIQCSHSYWNVTVPGYQDRIRAVMNISDLNFVLNPYHLTYFSEFLDNYFGRHLFAYIGGKPLIREYCESREQLANMRSTRETSFLMNIHRWSLFVCAGIDPAVKVPSFFSYVRLKIPYCSYYTKSTKSCTNFTLSCPRNIEITPHLESFVAARRRCTTTEDHRRLYLKGVSISVLYLFGNSDVEYVNVGSFRIESFHGQMRLDNVKCFSDIWDSFRLSFERKKTNLVPLVASDFEVGSLDLKLFHEDNSMIECVVPSGLKVLVSNLQHSSIRFTTRLEVGLILISLWVPTSHLLEESIADCHLVKKTLDKMEYTEVASFSSRLRLTFRILEKLSSLTDFKQMEELKKADFYQRNIRFLWKETSELMTHSRTRKDLKGRGSSFGVSSESRHRTSLAGSSSDIGEIPESIQEFWMQIKSNWLGECNEEEELPGEQNFSCIKLAVPESMKCTVSLAAIQTGMNLIKAFMSDEEEHVELIVCKIWKEHLERCIAAEEDTVSNYKFSFHIPEVKVKIRKMMMMSHSSCKSVSFSSMPDIYLYLSSLNWDWSLFGSRSKAKETRFRLDQILVGITTLDGGGVDEQSTIIEMNSVLLRDTASSGKENVNMSLDSLSIGDNLNDLKSLVRCCMLVAKLDISYWSSIFKNQPKTIVADIFSLCVISGEASTGLVTSQVRKIFLSAISRIRTLNQVERSRILALLQSSSSRNQHYSSGAGNRKVPFECSCRWNQFSWSVENVIVLASRQIFLKYSCFSGRNIFIFLANELHSRTSSQLVSKIAYFVRECISIWRCELNISQGEEWTASALERMMLHRKTYRSMPQGSFIQNQWNGDSSPLLLDNGQASEDALVSLSSAPFFFSSSRRVHQKRNNQQLVSTLSAPWEANNLYRAATTLVGEKDAKVSPQQSLLLLRSLSSFEAKTTWNELDIQPSVLSAAPTLVDVIISIDKIHMQLGFSTESVLSFCFRQNVAYLPLSFGESLEHSSILCSSEEMEFKVHGPNEEEENWITVLLNTPQYVISLQHNGRNANVVASILAMENISIRVEYSFFSAWHLFELMADELRSFLLGDRETVVDARTASSQMYNIPPLNVAVSECRIQLPLSENEKKLQYKVQDLRATSCELSHTENIIVVRVPSQFMEYLDHQIALDLVQLPSAVLEARITNEDGERVGSDNQPPPFITNYRFHLAFKAIESEITKERIIRLKSIFEEWNRPRKHYQLGKPKTATNNLLTYNNNNMTTASPVTRCFSLVISLQTLSLTGHLMGIHSELFLDNFYFVLTTNAVIPYPDIHITFRNIGLVIRLTGSLPSRFSITQFQSHIRVKHYMDSNFLNRLHMTSLSSMKECEVFMDKRCLAALILLADEFKYYECDEEDESTSSSLMTTVAEAALRLCVYLLTKVRVGLIRMTFVIDNNYDIRISAYSPSLSFRIDNWQAFRYRLVLTGSFESANIYQQSTPVLTFQGSCIDCSWLSGKVACFVDVGSYTLSLDHAIRLLPESTSSSEENSAIGTQIFTRIDFGVNINAGVITLKSTRYLDTDIQVPGLYCNLFLDVALLKAVFLFDWDYANMDLKQEQLEHLIKWLFSDRPTSWQERWKQSQQQPVHHKSSSTSLHRRMKTIASFTSSSRRKRFQWSMIVRISRSYLRLQSSLASPGMMMLSASVGVPEAQFLFCPGSHPVHGKDILLASGGFAHWDISLNQGWRNNASQQHCIGTGMDFLVDLTSRIGTCKLKQLAMDLDLASLFSLQNIFQHFHPPSTNHMQSNSPWEIQPLRKLAMSICIQDWSTNAQEGVKLLLKMVQQSSGSMDVAFHRCFVHFGYIEDCNFFYLHCGRGQIRSTRQHFHGKGGMAKLYVSQLSTSCTSVFSLNLDSFGFHLSQQIDDTMDGDHAAVSREEILKLACKQFSWKAHESSDEVLRPATNAIDMDIWIKGLHGALCSTSSPALSRLKESLLLLLTETKRFHANNHPHTLFATPNNTASHSGGNTSNDTPTVRSTSETWTTHQKKRLCIHGDHLLLSLYAMHFREQDFVRMMSNQYEILFSQALDSRTQGQNRQLQVRFDSFSIQRESLSDPSSRGDILKVPNPHLKLSTLLLYPNDLYYDLYTDFDGPIQISSRVSQYRYMRHIFQLYFSPSRSEHHDWTPNSSSSLWTMEHRYRIHRQRLEFQPQLNALGELTPSLDMWLSWLGVGGDAGRIPLLFYEHVLEQLDRWMMITRTNNNHHTK